MAATSLHATPTATPSLGGFVPCAAKLAQFEAR